MKSTLIFMSAFLESFDQIDVWLSKDYFSLENVSFYLRNNTYARLHQMDVVEVFEVEDGFVYRCAIECIELGSRFEVCNHEGFTVPLAMGAISKDHRFDALFEYTGKDLGVTYTPHASHFAIHVPLSCHVILEYVKEDKVYVQTMERCDYGVYRCVVVGDLEGCKYVFLIEHGGVMQRCIDVYGYDACLNHQYSIVVNLNNVSKVVPLECNDCTVIYELNVRDFSYDPHIDFKHRGKFLGLVEQGLRFEGCVVGFDYLKDLGISHVQLMPVHDFATVEELDVHRRYNWGYDPVHCFVLEGSYCYDNRLNEFIEMVNAFHREGIGVIVDVVFNHMYDVVSSAFHKMTPHYYYLCDESKIYSNGSGCSNDCNSQSKMVSSLFVEMVRRFATILGVDGIRFDLMGILDIETVNEMFEVCRAVNPCFMMYGEGWNMDTMLPYEQRAIMEHYDKLPNIGFFNDVFRNTFKGSDDGCLGFLFDMNMAMYFKDDYLPIQQSINYLACHDNHTLYDYLTRLGLDVGFVDICNSIVLLSGGVAFIHGGQEFLRSKQGVRNSYNCSDLINQMDWSLVLKNKQHVTFVEKLIILRKKYGSNHKIEYVEHLDTVIVFKVGSLFLYCNCGLEQCVHVHGRLLLSSKDNVLNEGSLWLEAHSVSIVEGDFYE